MEYKGFEGWYFKHQKAGNTLAIIVGRAGKNAFVQIIFPDSSKYYTIKKFTHQNGIIRADNCIFTDSGCSINLPDVHGTILYGKLTPLSSDIMGPFKFLPLECKHRIISMGHNISGSVMLGEKQLNLDGGKGYIEADSGISFPDSYLWLHCSDFEKDLSVMLSVARIPLFSSSFSGCICSILFEGQEFKLATYRTARILSREVKHICIAQRTLCLEADIEPKDRGHVLSSPQNGRMTGMVRESSNAHIRLRLYKSGKQVFDEKSDNCSFELVPGIFYQ